MPSCIIRIIAYSCCYRCGCSETRRQVHHDLPGLLLPLLLQNEGRGDWRKEAQQGDLPGGGGGGGRGGGVGRGRRRRGGGGGKGREREEKVEGEEKGL